jgi:hypothetical protein
LRAAHVSRGRRAVLASTPSFGSTVRVSVGVGKLRAPFPEGVQLEIRQIFEDGDFAPSDPTGELRAKDEKLRQEIARQA